MGSRRLRRAAAALVVTPVVALVVVVAGADGAEGRVAPEPTVTTVGPGSPAGLEEPGPPVPVAAPASGWAWPLQPRPVVLARFDPPEVAWASGHRGVDLAASVGQDVLAPVAGTVTVSGVVVDRGVVVVTTTSGLRTTLEPVQGTVPAGSTVARGQVVGRVTDTPGHCAPQVCLHWGVLRGEAYLDPLAFVTRRPVVLLPLAPP